MAADPGRQRITRELLFAAFAGPSTEGDDPRLLERIATSVEEENVRPGHVLYREGDDSAYVHFMTEGRMRLSRPGYEDWVYEGRWVVGTTDVLASRPRTRTATMETASRLFRLPAARWFDVMQDRPEVLLNALVGFARGVTALYARLAPDGGFRRDDTPGLSADASTFAGRALLLASLPLLRAVPSQIAIELARLAEPRELEAGESLFAAGMPPGRVFVVTRGSVEARREDPAVTSVFAAGSVVGGAVCLGDSEAAWSARALARSQVLTFSVEDLLDHIEEHQDAVRAIMAVFAVERERLCEVLASRLGELVLR